jgi:hypothetical protein
MQVEAQVRAARVELPEPRTVRLEVSPPPMPVRRPAVPPQAVGLEALPTTPAPPLVVPRVLELEAVDLEAPPTIAAQRLAGPQAQPNPAGPPAVRLPRSTEFRKSSRIGFRQDSGRRTCRIPWPPTSWPPSSARPRLADGARV